MTIWRPNITGTPIDAIMYDLRLILLWLPIAQITLGIVISALTGLTVITFFITYSIEDE
ncbi:hypothetical protein DFH09DRAFT_1326600 [Mycena vulgaris]|nr:hypothetical protein DFH09DRAFT_1326600 [Mycena vulgaris]